MKQSNQIKSQTAPSGAPDMFKVIFSDEDIRWQSIIYELVRSGKVNPWDVDISKFTKEYMNMLEKLKKMDFRVSGKVVLSAAILLKLKTQHLGLNDFIVLTEDQPEEDLALSVDDGEYTDPDEERLLQLARNIKSKKKKTYRLEPRLVGPRRRKVTVFELVDALKKALEVDDRRTTKRVKFEHPSPAKKYEGKKTDIMRKIKDVHRKLILKVSKKNKKIIPFMDLIQKENKKEIIWIFVPLLYLANDEKVWLHQKEPFSDIQVELLNKEVRQ